jgi:hypothetical protein
LEPEVEGALIRLARQQDSEVVALGFGRVGPARAGKFAPPGQQGTTRPPLLELS